MSTPNRAFKITQRNTRIMMAGIAASTALTMKTTIDGNVIRISVTTTSLLWFLSKTISGWLSNGCPQLGQNDASLLTGWLQSGQELSDIKIFQEVQFQLYLQIYHIIHYRWCRRPVQQANAPPDTRLAVPSPPIFVISRWQCRAYLYKSIQGKIPSVF